MKVAVVSPEEVLFEGEASQVITRTSEGDIAFLSGHAPFVGTLAEGETRVFLPGGEVRTFHVADGFVEVSHDTVSILTA